MSKRYFGLTMLGFALLCAGLPTGAAYQFTLLSARSNGAPAINNAGHIAYYATNPANGLFTLYFWDGAGRVAISNDSVSSIASQPIINDNDSLVMHRSNGNQTMVWDPVNGARELYPATGNFLFGMNNAGTIVTSVNGTGGGEVWTGDGGPMTLVQSSTLGTGWAAINDAGTVAVYNRNASATSESLGYVSAGQFTPIATTATGYSSITNPSINNAGAIAFAAVHAGDHLYRYSNGILGDVTPQGFTHAIEVSINDLGDVAYHQASSVTLDRIRVGTNTVINRGDPLFGSTVSLLQFGTHGINDSGQVVFFAFLADGRQVSVLAQVPEPALGLFVPAILLLRGRRPRNLNA